MFDVARLEHWWPTSACILSFCSFFSYYWFRKTQPETSNYTRLLAADKPDHLMDEIPTFLTKHWNISEDNYVAYNKVCTTCRICHVKVFYLHCPTSLMKLMP